MALLGCQHVGSRAADLEKRPSEDVTIRREGPPDPVAVVDEPRPRGGRCRRVADQIEIRVAGDFPRCKCGEDGPDRFAQRDPELVDRPRACWLSFGALPQALSGGSLQPARELCEPDDVGVRLKVIVGRTDVRAPDRVREIERQGAAGELDPVVRNRRNVAHLTDLTAYYLIDWLHHKP